LTESAFPCYYFLVKSNSGPAATGRGEAGVLPVLLCLFPLILLPARSLAEQPAEREDLFFTALGMASLNARSGAAGGGGLAAGFGDGTALGLKFLFSGSGDPLRVLETALFFRCYLPSFRGHQGLFAQAELGSSIMYGENRRWGDFYGGLAVGWRFLFQDRWYLEPVLQAGYPFIAGGGIGAGFRL
jgi:hypothetical protein